MNDSNSFLNFYFKNRIAVNYFFCFFLFCFLLGKGIIPGWQHINSDFPNYYTSSRLALEKKQIDFYNDSLFNAEIKNYGINESGKFSPFPPATVFMMMPLCKLHPLTAKRTFIAINLILLIPVAFYLSKISGLVFVESLNLILLSGINLANNFYLGQVYLLMLLFMLVSHRFFVTGNYFLSGIFSGIFAAIKYFPVLFLFPFLKGKKRNAVSGFLFAIFVLSVAVIPFTGIKIYSDFIDVPFQHLNGNLSGQSPFSSTFQSWNALFHNLFVFDETENANPLIRSALLYNFFRFLIPLVLIAAGYFAFRKLKNILPENELHFCLPSLVALAILPASATYHYILLLFPFTFLLKWLTKFRMHSHAFVLLLLFTSIGFVPFLLDLFFQNFPVVFYLKFHRLFLITLFYCSVIFSLLILAKKNQAVTNTTESC